MLTNPSVADVAVIGIEDANAGEIPKAFVVLKQGLKATEKEIQSFVARTLTSPFTLL